MCTHIYIYIVYVYIFVCTFLHAWCRAENDKSQRKLYNCALSAHPKKLHKKTLHIHTIYMLYSLHNCPDTHTHTHAHTHACTLTPTNTHTSTHYTNACQHKPICKLKL